MLPEILTSYADFERIYGGFADLALTVGNAADARPINYLAHAVRAYFNEGGSRLYVARVYLANGAAAGTASSADLRVGAAPPAEDDTNRIRFVARFPGRCGNGAVPTIEQPNLRGIQTREIVAPAPQRVLDSAPVGSIVRTGVGPFGYFLKRDGQWFLMAEDGSVAADAVAADAAALADASLITLAVITTDADGGSLAMDDLGYDRSHPRWVGTVMSPTPNRRADQIENLYALRIGTRGQRPRAAQRAVPGRAEHRRRCRGHRGAAAQRPARLLRAERRRRRRDAHRCGLHVGLRRAGQDRRRGHRRRARLQCLSLRATRSATR